MSDAGSALRHLVHDIHGHAAKFGDAADQLRDADPERRRALLALIRRSAGKLIELVDAYKEEGTSK